MPEPSPAEMLVQRWQQALNDLALQDLPYKIELNAWGKVEMTPASNRHGRLQAVLALELGRQLQGMVIMECSILTRIGIRVPDLAWASPQFMQSFGEITPYTHAPEICVEILSPTSVAVEVAAKSDAYLAAGAYEVWLVSEDGAVRFVGAGGDQPKSRFPVVLSLPGRLKNPP